MKASSLFAVTIALLLALGTAVGARALGLFNPSTPPKEQQPVIRILVARANLYEGISITPDQVYVRDLRSNEMDFFQKNSEKFLPPTPDAAALRTPIRNIESDQPILKTDLLDLAFPDGVALRTAPGMRAINVAVAKENSAGGLIAKGDYVDVLLTSRVGDSENPARSSTLSAFIARNLRVIVKRNTLWTVLRGNPDNQLVSFTLEANPYRAALLEFASTKGTFTLMPTSAPRKEGITPIGAELGRTSTPTFSIPDSVEYKDEDLRVDQLLKGELSITEADLDRIFRLKPIIRRPAPRPIVIQQISGNRPAGNAVFSADGDYLGGSAPAKKAPEGSSTGPESIGSSQPHGYSFSPPGATK